MTDIPCPWTDPEYDQLEAVFHTARLAVIKHELAKANCEVELVQAEQTAVDLEHKRYLARRSAARPAEDFRERTRRDREVQAACARVTLAYEAMDRLNEKLTRLLAVDGKALREAEASARQALWAREEAIREELRAVLAAEGVS